MNKIDVDLWKRYSKTKSYMNPVNLSFKKNLYSIISKIKH